MEGVGEFIGKIFPIGLPVGWIGLDIIGDALPFGPAANDVFVAVALLDRGARRAAQTVDAPG